MLASCPSAGLASHASLTQYCQLHRVVDSRPAIFEAGVGASVFEADVRDADGETGLGQSAEAVPLVLTDLHHCNWGTNMQQSEGSVTLGSDELVLESPYSGSA